MQACESVMLCWKRDLGIQETTMSTGKALSLESGGDTCVNRGGCSEVKPRAGLLFFSKCSWLRSGCSSNATQKKPVPICQPAAA